MHAVILAGGRGVRLRPYTTSLPKPLVPLGDEYAIIEVVRREHDDVSWAAVLDEAHRLAAGEGV